MKIKIIKSGPWEIGGNQVKFSEGQALEVGVDVPDNIAEDMLRCEYAIKANPAGRPRMETKEKAIEPDKDSKESKKDLKDKKHKR
jgi:hypothetical protein